MSESTKLNNFQNIKYYIFVTSFFPSPDNWRGAYVLDQVKAIQRNSDYEVVVFVGGRKTDRDYFIDNIRVYRYRILELPSNILNGFFNEYNSRSFVDRVLEIGIEPKDVAFVHCHVSMRAACGLALKKLNPEIKVLLQHHDLDPFNLRSGVIGRNNRFNIRYRAKKAIELYNQVDLHICVSNACKECLLQFPNPRHCEIYDDSIRSLNLCKGLASIRPKDTYILYNGVDTELFNPAINLHKEQESKKVFRIGCVSNFNVLKDHITLIKAFSRLYKEGYNNVVLSLLGTGETRAMCEEYIKKNGLAGHVEWPSEVEHDKLPDYYQSLDLFVLPSYSEGFGCVFTEAAACGVPFMGCLNQGYSEYIPDKEKYNWLIEPKDDVKLAELIIEYVEQKRPQSYAHSFDINDLIKEYLVYIQSV